MNNEKRWSGRTVVCIASGPSLSKNDCDLVRSSGHPAIAVNNSWQLARFADAIYAGDACWWKHYGGDIDIPAERWTCSENAAQSYGINWHRVRGEYNSGLRALQLAMDFGAAKIILLGYDCTVKNGVHWHPDHIKTKNPDAAKCAIWNTQFMRLKKTDCEIINCSRVTALTCFVKKTLEEALC